MGVGRVKKKFRESYYPHGSWNLFAPPHNIEMPKHETRNLAIFAFSSFFSLFSIFFHFFPFSSLVFFFPSWKFWLGGGHVPPKYAPAAQYFNYLFIQKFPQKRSQSIYLSNSQKKNLYYNYILQFNFITYIYIYICNVKIYLFSSNYFECTLWPLFRRQVLLLLH